MISSTGSVDILMITTGIKASRAVVEWEDVTHLAFPMMLSCQGTFEQEMRVVAATMKSLVAVGRLCPSIAIRTSPDVAKNFKPIAKKALDISVGTRPSIVVLKGD